MVSLETPTPVTVNPSIQNQQMNVSSDYEKCREQRIKENLERMQKLGIYDLSLKMKSIKPNRYRKNNKPVSADQNKTPMPTPVPTRRSSRLQSTPAVSYSEVDLPKKGKVGDEKLMAKNTKPEAYTEEHEKLLGEAKTEWTLFVDGYGKDGKRIYDQVRGKTCHQCRQKTLGYRTHCIKCSMVQGQFCGDCLYMRYGENVLEAMQNPNWICPVCRGICNCSLCRQAKGWAPTGMLYRKISSQGYKSVAHYLIQTRQSYPKIETIEKTDTQVCAKRSLPFSMEEVNTVEIIESKDENNKSKVKNSESEVNTDEKVTELQSSEKSIINNVKLESDQVLKEKSSEAEVNEGEIENSQLTNVENKVNIDDQVNPVNVTPETKTGSRKKRCVIVIEGSVAGRLRSKDENNKSIVNSFESEVNTDEKVTELQSSEKSIINNAKLVGDQGLKENSSEAEVNEGEKEKSDLTNVENKANAEDEVNPVNVTPETKTGSRKKRFAITIEDSIAGRLRSRRTRA